MEQKEGQNNRITLKEVISKFEYNSVTVEKAITILNMMEQQPVSLQLWVSRLYDYIKTYCYGPGILFSDRKLEAEVTGILYALLFHSRFLTNVKPITIKTFLIEQFRGGNELEDLFTSDFYLSAKDIKVFFDVRKDRTEHIGWDELCDLKELQEYTHIIFAMEKANIFSEENSFENIYQNIMLVKHVLYIYLLESFFKVTYLDFLPKDILKLITILSKVETILYGTVEIKELLKQVFSGEVILLNKVDLNNIAKSFSYTSDTVLLQYLFHETTIAIEDELKTENRELLLYFAQRLNITIDLDFLPDTTENYGELDDEDDDSDEMFPEEISHSKTLLNYTLQKESQDKLF
jgi:hypothetical protein